MRKQQTLLLIGLVNFCNIILANSFYAKIPHKTRKFQSKNENNFMKMGIDLDGPYWKVSLEARGSSAEIAALGACVTSFKVDDYDWLFCRPDSKYDGSKPISGGIPICWPQFGSGKLQQHGFARNLNWELVGMDYGESESALFRLTANAETKTMWDHDFELYYNVTLSPGKLNLQLEVNNIGQAPFTFTTALHSYFRTSSVSQVTVQGPFKGAPFLDKTFTPPTELIYPDEKVTICSETDRVFLGVRDGIILEDKPLKKVLNIRNIRGFQDTIIWNPYGKTEMGADHFVCIESGTVGEVITVHPGASWVGEMELEPETLDKCI